MMATLSSDAHEHLDRYLKEVKAALRAHPSIDAGEVERDVLGHIHAELAGQPEPVTMSRLSAVLDRLGAPDTWVRPEERGPQPPVNRWLAQLAPPFTAVLFAAGIVFFLGGPVFWPIEPVMVIASMLVARASLELLADRDEPIGARRWLLYPPLVLWCLVLGAALLGWPIAPLVLASNDMPALERSLRAWFGAPVWSGVLALVVAGIGIWWTILGLILIRVPGAVHAAFRPFGDWFDRSHARRLSLAGLLLAAIAGVAMAVLMNRS